MLDRQRRIHLATDSPQIASIITSKLTRDGFKVSWKRSGRDCLENLHLETPDLIILDSILLDLSAHELLQTIRQNPVLGEVPIFVLLDALEGHSQDDFLKRGASLVLAKPFRPTDLSKKIRRILSVSPPGPPAPQEAIAVSKKI